MTKIKNEHSIDLALEAKKAMKQFYEMYPNSPFDKYYMGYVHGFHAAMKLVEDTDGVVSDD